MDQRVHAIRLFRALRNGPSRIESLRTVRTGRDDRARDHEHAWPRDDPLFDRLLETHIRFACAFCAEIAYGGEPREQRVAHVIRRASNAKGERLVQHLEASGFVVMKKPPASAPTTSHMPPPVGSR